MNGYIADALRMTFGPTGLAKRLVEAAERSATAAERQAEAMERQANVAEYNVLAGTTQIGDAERRTLLKTKISQGQA